MGSKNSKIKTKEQEFNSRKLCMIETASMLELPFESSSFKDSDIIELLDMGKVIKQSAAVIAVIVNYSVAPLCEIFPNNNSWQWRERLSLRASCTIPESLKIKTDFEYGPIYYISENKDKYIVGNPPNQSIVINDVNVSHLDAVKCFYPRERIRKSFPLQKIKDMTFQTDTFFNFNGLNFYPTNIISDDPGKEIIRFKSDGLIISAKNDELISQIQQDLVTNKNDINKVYDAKGNSELSEGGILLGKRIALKKRLQIELKKPVEKHIYLTLDLPVGWSFIAYCYWANVSIIKE